MRIGREPFFALVLTGVLTTLAAFTTQPTFDGFDRSATVDEVLRAGRDEKGEDYRGGDYASYLLAAERLREGRADWAYTRLWPLGQPALAALVVSISGPERYPAKMAIFCVGLWTLAFAGFALAFSGTARILLASAYLGGMWFLTPALKNYNFGLGSIMTEASSGPFFLAGTLLLTLAIHRERKLFAVLGGLSFAIAALIRPYFELTVLHPLLGLSALAWSLNWWRRRRAALSRALAVFATCTTLATLAAHGALLPYRVYRSIAFGSAQLTNFDQLTTWAFTPDDQLPSFHHSGNVACQVEPDVCELVNENKGKLRKSLVRKLVFMTYLSRPFQWIGLKLTYFDWLWFGDEFERLEPVEWAEGLLLLGLGLFGLALLVARLVRGAATNAELALLVLTLAFIVANCGGFLLYQFEWRYSQALRVGAYVLPLLALALHESDPKSMRQIVA